jgi:hypothetical protein
MTQDRQEVIWMQSASKIVLEASEKGHVLEVDRPRHIKLIRLLIRQPPEVNEKCEIKQATMDFH